MEKFFLIIVFFAVVGFLAIRHIKKRANEMSSLMSRGTEVTGKVVEVRKVRKSRTHKSFQMRYKFVTSGGIEYERKVELRPTEFDQYREGQAIEIVYDPVNPENNVLKRAMLAARDALSKQQAPK